MDFAEQLQKLQTLREQGVLTEEEFTQAKKRVLDAIGDAPKQEAPRQASQPNALQQLRRSFYDKWIGGVCGGLAEMTGVPSWAWRILFVLSVLLNGLGLLVYLLLWIFVPLQTKRPASTMYETP
ncbi:MAG: PspC domain-containing protein [Betaproteobacteria bacterium]|nr:PspC domain-containing protein [Betaproteobacteria bacterium]